MMDFITNNILRNPPMLLGIIAAIGLLLQKKKIADVIKGSLLASFGMVILEQGTGMLVGAIAPINGAFQSLSGSVKSEGLNDVTFTTTYGGAIGMAMFIALVIHLLIARFTPIKTIFLTGHMLWWFPFIFVAAGVEGGLRGGALIAFAAISSALYWSIMPWILRKYVSAVTNDDSFTLGHPSGCLTLISGFVASKVGNKEKSCEDLKLPAGLSFFREISISGGIVIFIMFLLVGIFIPGAFAKTNENIVIYAIKQGFMFGAGLIVMLQGVRMLINQIIPAFKGISEKVVPNAIPAFDCPILFNYKPNAVLIGFLTAMITSTVIILLCNYFNIFNILLIPLVITSFFECGTAAVIGEGQGGLKGALVGTSVASIFMVCLVGISACVFSSTIQNWILIFGGNDLSLFGVIGKFIASIFGGF
ncbi:PTS system, ascorbate-specific IIC component [Clostridium cavendishii DSM 21758]|uniref:Ascorbate-specific PTS system EIIC component n=1 Tax=Clostridium cavendishii DSM 21758 TaxID=1121302 RepID=A0A1M6R000_9CLOT|nr:PTS ascorbate transporter subunit IIC [Clostridium cavendishii]SHK25815.1 PTS system, ascorbate-specific IIC component [Clostridium cavendishii DSM 21758]